MSGFLKTIISSLKEYLCLLLFTLKFVTIKQFSAEIWMISCKESVQISTAIGVQIVQKRLCTLCSKCYHGAHNDPRLLKFSTQIPLFRQLCNDEILIRIFPTGCLVLNLYQSLFLPFLNNIPSLLMCPFFGLKLYEYKSSVITKWIFAFEKFFFFIFSDLSSKDI